MIKNIVFDFGGVLVRHDFVTYFTKVFSDPEKGMYFLTHILTEERNNMLDRGDKPVGECLAEWKRQWPDCAAVIDAFDKHYTDLFVCEIPGIVELMTSLKGQGYRLLGLSNWSAKVFDVMAKFPRPFSLLDGYLVSHQVHLLKPDPAIYRAFCHKFSVLPQECVFIDDRPTNVEGAKAVGMQGIVFKDTEQLKAELMQIL